MELSDSFQLRKAFDLLALPAPVYPEQQLAFLVCACCLFYHLEMAGLPAWVTLHGPMVCSRDGFLAGIKFIY